MAKRLQAGRLSFYRVSLTIEVDDYLYGSGPTSDAGIEAAVERNMPTGAQLRYREEAGEEIRPLADIEEEMQQAARFAEEAAKLEGQKSPNTVFRRDAGGVYLHSNYLKGHLRECGENVGRASGHWGVKDLVTRTVSIAPEKIYLPMPIKSLTTFFTPDVRTKGGVVVKQSTEKITEYVESPILNYTLYLLADPRWTRDLLEDILIHGSMRGFGPGRAIDESKYEFSLGKFESLNYQDGRAEYRQQFRSPGSAEQAQGTREAGDRSLGVWPGWSGVRGGPASRLPVDG